MGEKQTKEGRKKGGVERDASQGNKMYWNTGKVMRRVAKYRLIKVG